MLFLCSFAQINLISMKKIFAGLSLLLTLTGVAQTKTKSKKTTTAPVVKDVQLEGIKQEELVSGVVEAPPVVAEIRDTKIGVYSSNNDGYYLSNTYQDKNVIIAYKGDSYSNRRYALLDYMTKKELTPFIFESIGSFYSGDNTTATVNGKSGVIDNKGKIVLPCVYDELTGFSVDGQQFYIASLNSAYGVIAENGMAIIPFEYDKISSSYYSRTNTLNVSKNKKWGVINFISKKVIVPLEYDELYSEVGTYKRVKKNGLYNLLAADNTLAFSKWYKSMSAYDENNIIVDYQGKKGIIDINEKQIVPLEYEELSKIYTKGSATAFLVKKGDKYGVVKPDGSFAVPLEYSSLKSSYSTELLIAEKDGKKGLVSGDGKIVLPITYDEITNDDKGFVIKQNGKTGIVGKDGSEVIAPVYESLEIVDNDYSSASGLILATKNGKKGLLDKAGRVKLEFIYDDIVVEQRSSYYSTVSIPNPAIAIKGGKYGMIEANGTQVLPFEYTSLQYMSSFLVIAEKNGKYGIRSIYENKIALPFEYKFISYKKGNGVAYNNSFVAFKTIGNNVVLDNKTEQK